MDLLIELDRGAAGAPRTPAHAGRLICTLVDQASTATLTASNAPEAAAALLTALDATRETGFGECFWNEPQGDYRWMFRRDGGQVTLVVLWSTGVITGWAHVFRSEADFAWLDGRVRSELGKLEVRS